MGTAVDYLAQFSKKSPFMSFRGYQNLFHPSEFDGSIFKKFIFS